jgi:hypothetical protein
MRAGGDLGKRPYQKFQFTRPSAQKRMGVPITTGAEVSTFEQRREALKQNVRKPKLSRRTKWRIY